MDLKEPKWLRRPRCKAKVDFSKTSRIKGDIRQCISAPHRRGKHRFKVDMKLKPSNTKITGEVHWDHRSGKR